ncbi:MAG: transposase [Opitutaceae bacterium]|jgi:REP element-mobilizing transposase RayT|nr:transposase [Opitutaceae bacterium]
MRTSRIKIHGEDAVYHCISRTVNGERLFDEDAKEMFRRQMWQIADYCGVSILTYAIMENHFHVLVRVPKKAPISDGEHLRRYRLLYPEPTRFQTASLAAVEAQLKAGGPDADAWRKQQLALMDDVSAFMKLLKQRFTIWFNKTHNRFGTLWAERFKSVLVQSDGRAVRVVAAYIDLNPVRAGLVDDPKDYRFCGYSEAVAGRKIAQSGLVHVIGEDDARTWQAAQEYYRLMIIGSGAKPRAGKAAVSENLFEETMHAGGKLPLTTALRCQIRYFTNGGVLGGRAFVAKHLTLLRRKTGLRRRKEPCVLPPVCDWGGTGDGSSVGGNSDADEIMVLRTPRRRTLASG